MLYRKKKNHYHDIGHVMQTPALAWTQKINDTIVIGKENLLMNFTNPK